MELVTTQHRKFERVNIDMITHTPRRNNHQNNINFNQEQNGLPVKMRLNYITKAVPGKSQRRIQEKSGVSNCQNHIIDGG